jgi:phospholipid transport system transporter-binding protein
LAFVPQVRNVEVIEAAPDRLDVRGALTFATARSAYEAGLRMLRNRQSSSPLQVDCAGVTESDSAGLAVLIEWLACATQLGRKMRFVNLPDGIRAAAQISDVAEMLEAGA